MRVLLLLPSFFFFRGKKKSTPTQTNWSWVGFTSLSGVWQKMSMQRKLRSLWSWKLNLSYEFKIVIFVAELFEKLYNLLELSIFNVISIFSQLCTSKAFKDGILVNHHEIFLILYINTIYFWYYISKFVNIMNKMTHINI